MEDDLYGDLVTSAGDAGAGLLKEKARAHAGAVVSLSILKPRPGKGGLRRHYFLTPLQVAELEERAATQAAELTALSTQKLELTAEVGSSSACAACTSSMRLGRHWRGPQLTVFFAWHSETA